LGNRFCFFFRKAASMPTMDFAFNALLRIINRRTRKSLHQRSGAVKRAKKLPEGDSGREADAALVLHAGEWPKTLD
jgi:hypothetical protein